VSLSAVPGIVAQIREDMEATEKQMTYWLDRMEEAELKHQEVMDSHQREVNACKHRIRDMECTARTLEQYTAGTFGGEQG
jgi:hypothetical protein